MSYDIDVLTPDGREWSLNWLRNPFGLCTFVEDNVGDGDRSLWHACNDHTYNDVTNLDRVAFLRVVADYWDRLRGLKTGFFQFTFRAYVQFVPDHEPMLVHGQDRDHVWCEDGRILRINVERFRHDRGFGWHGRDESVLQFYKDWFEQLVKVAEAMQDPDAKVEITN